MRIRLFCIRALSVFMLVAFMLVNGFQISENFSTAKKKSPVREDIELTALLPAQSPAADANLKFQKSVSDYCFFMSGYALVTACISQFETRGFFPHAKPQIVRLLMACISINAP